MLGRRLLLLPVLTLLLSGCGLPGWGRAQSASPPPTAPAASTPRNAAAAPPGGMGPASVVLSPVIVPATATAAAHAASPAPSLAATITPVAPTVTPSAPASATSAPVAPTVTPAAAPELRVVLPALPPVQRGAAARVRAVTSPGALCTLSIEARPAAATTFGPRQAGATGAVAWILTIARHDHPGDWALTVRCHDGAAGASAARTLAVR